MQGSRFFAYVFLLLSVPAFPCICAVPRTPSEWYAVHHGKPTFIGVAISVARVSDVVRMGGGKPIVDSSGKPVAVAMIQRVTFKVKESFEGVKTHDIEVYGFGTTCDYRFIAGQKYLVYGWLGEDGKIRTSMCTRTALFSEATEDVNFLRSVKSRGFFALTVDKSPLHSLTPILANERRKATGIGKLGAAAKGRELPRAGRGARSPTHVRRAHGNTPSTRLFVFI